MFLSAEVFLDGPANKQALVKGCRLFCQERTTLMPQVHVCREKRLPEGGSRVFSEQQISHVCVLDK